METDRARALDAFHEALVLTREQRIPWFEARAARETASLEAVQGDLDEGLHFFEAAIDAYHHAGNQADLAAVLAELAIFFDRNAQPDIAATVYGISSRQTNANWVVNLSAAVDHLRAVLGDTAFEECAANGAGMDAGDAVRYVRQKIQACRRQLSDLP